MVRDIFRTAVFNPANEKIGFTQIPTIVETVLGQAATLPIDHLEAVMAIDADARYLAAEAVTKNRSYL